MIFLRSLNFEPSVYNLLYLILITHVSLTIVEARCGNEGNGVSKNPFNSSPDCQNSECVKSFHGKCYYCNNNNKDSYFCVLESVDMNIFYSDEAACRKTGCLSLGLHCKKISTVDETTVCEDTG